MNEPIIIEAGASAGENTIGLSKQFPKGAISAFGPLPDVFQKLKKAVRGCNNVVLFQEALSDSTGKADIHISNNKCLKLFNEN